MQLLESNVVSTEQRASANQLINLLRTIISHVCQHINEAENGQATSVAFACQINAPQGVGRPRMIVDNQQITYLRRLQVY